MIKHENHKMSKSNFDDENNLSSSSCETSVKNKPKLRAKKRKRLPSSSDEDILPENTLEVERSLQESALKNNLDEASVKKILKKVVTNDHVLALVKLREEEEESSTDEKLQPKITRAKAKELSKVSPSSAPWNINLTPIKRIPVKTRPEVEALIAQELPEDEDDEEYEPSHDDVPSDDDHVLESCSDLESQPRTPATPKSKKKDSPKIVNDGPFKVPQEVSQVCRKLSLEEEEATIARRTRSKLSLSATSIEHIESSFVPPDDLPVPDVDDLWNDFLKDCLNPASNARNEDDDETDPEYNVAADPDAVDEYDESLENSIIKISRKELNDLVTELFHIMPEVAESTELDQDVNIAEGSESQHLESTGLEQSVAGDGLTQVRLQITHWEGKQEPLSEDEAQTEHNNSVIETQNYQRFSIGKSEPEEIVESQQVEENEEETPVTVPSPISKTVTISMAEKSSVEDTIAVRRPPPLLQVMISKPPEPVRIELDTDKISIEPHQITILQQQLRQHVQLAASNFLQLYVHPIHWGRAPQYREYLDSLIKIVEKNPASVANVCNLKPAWELIQSWEKSLDETTKENTELISFVKSEVERCRRRSSNHNLVLGEFPPRFLSVIANSSSVFLYPTLLPAAPYRADPVRRCHYLRSEDRLIVLALDQFWSYVEANPELYPRPGSVHPRRRWGLTAAATLACDLLFPALTTKMLISHIGCARKANDPNCPIVKFFKDRTVEPVTHRLLPYNPQLTLYEQPEYELPRCWVKYLGKNSKRFQKYFYRPMNLPTAPPSAGIEINNSENVKPPKKNPLPLDFTKRITYRKRVDCDNFTSEESPQNKIKIVIQPMSNQTSNDVTADVSTSESITAVVSISTDIVTSNINNSDSTVTQLTYTVNSVVNPICTPMESNTTESSNPNNKTIEDYENTIHNKGKAKENNKNRTLATLRLNKKRKTVSNTFIRKSKRIINRVRAAKCVLNNSKSTNCSENRVNKTKYEGPHCECCVLLRNICKIRQTFMTEYFKSKNNIIKCPCKSVNHPRLSNKFKLFIKLYKSEGIIKLEKLYDKIENVKNHIKRGEIDLRNEIKNENYSEEARDFAQVTAFQMKLSVRVSNLTNSYTKKRIHKLLQNFNLSTGDPLYICNELYVIMAAEMHDLYNEFVCLLTPEQADKLGYFKDYFIGNYFDDIMQRIEESVTNAMMRHELLTRIRAIFVNKSLTACEICTSLLTCLSEYPQLAQYTFSLFPHVNHEMPQHNLPEENVSKETNVVNVEISKETNVVNPEISEETNVVNPEISKETNVVNPEISKETNVINPEISKETHIVNPEISKEINVVNPEISKETNFVNPEINKETNAVNQETSKETNNVANEEISKARNDGNEESQETNVNQLTIQIVREINEDSYYDSRSGSEERLQICDDASHTMEDIEGTLSIQNDIQNDINIIPISVRNNGTCEEERLSIYEEAWQGINAMDYEADNSSSDTSERRQEHETVPEQMDTRDREGVLVKTIKYEAVDTPELTISTTDVQQNSCPEKSLMLTLEKTIKIEPPEWRREEDKLILETLKESITSEQSKNKNIVEFIQDEHFLKSIAVNLTDKSLDDIMQRAYYLLQLLVLKEG